MEVLNFKLSGDTAFFKKPDVNTHFFFSYNNIPRVTILGILGAILGFKGYALQGDSEYPEYYSKLRDLKIGIVPNTNGAFLKTIQTYTNTTGFFNKGKNVKEGETVIVKEQWLVNPSWDIYIGLDTKYAEVIKRAFLEESFIYMTYLGNNTHFANIEEICILEAKETKEYSIINSLFPTEIANIKLEFVETPFITKEYLPIALTSSPNYYITKELVYTNQIVEPIDSVYEIGGKYIYLIGENTDE